MFGQRVREVCVEDAGGDGVDGDAEVGRLARQAFSETDHRRLRGRIVHGGRERTDCADGSDVEDRAFALAQHLFVDRLGDGEEAVDVRVYDVIPRAVGGGGEVVRLVDGGVVDEHVHAAPLFDELAHDALHADAIRDGDFERMRAT